MVAAIPSGPFAFDVLSDKRRYVTSSSEHRVCQLDNVRGQDGNG